MKKIFTTLLCGLMSTAAFAQWSPTSMHGERIRPTSNVTSYYSLDLNQLRSQLSSAQETGKGAVAVEVKLPTLEGKIQRFAVYSAPVVVKSLADRYQLGSYVGVGVDDPTAYVRFSVSPTEFQSMMLRNGQYEFVEPQDKNKTVYGVHPKTNKSEADKAFICATSEAPLTKAQIDKLYMNGNSFAHNPQDFTKSSDRKYRTARLAMSVNGEYTQYFGGTVAGALVAINNTLTRCNFVFEKDFALTLILQDFPQLIYTNAATDPYSSMSNWNLELQQTLTSTIGNDAYDIGHMFGASGGGGNAGCIGCVCVNPTTSVPKGKGSGITSPADGIPQGDNFDIDYVAHEMGHQLGANHTFSMSLEGTGQNVEPGSGSTIMGYAGITGSTDVQPHSDAYFHINSIIQVQNNLIAKTCDIESATNNYPPVITALPAVTIPKGTAFVLTAQATDTEGDPLTYTWEQVDNASLAITKTNLGTTTSGASFRSFTGTADPSRYFPKFETVMSGVLSNPNGWEAVSSVARSSNYRVTVRDNNADTKQQQTAEALQAVTVHANGPFKITSTKVYNNAPGPLNWDVVGTNAAPFNVANVKIDYTLDNGTTWTVLAASTPNDGSEDFSFASLPTNTSIKVRISAIGNVFYAVAPVTVSAIVPCDGTAPAAFAVSNITTGAATVSWDPIASATYVVQYKKAADATWTAVPVTTNTYTITGLEEATAYQVQVASVCSGTTGTFSTVYNFTTIVPTYCAAGANSTSFEKISRVVFANIDKSSTSTAGYEDFTTIVGQVTKGQTYNFTASFAGTSYSTDQVTVWIDFNNDKDFDDEGEKVMISSVKNSPWTGTITIPSTAQAVTTRMRVRLNDTNSGGNSTPCGNSSYGQVEDYTLAIGTLAAGENTVHDIQIFPNPVSDIINVSMVSDSASYLIYNVSGQLVAKGSILNNKINVLHLYAGVYFIKVQDRDYTKTLKFIKK